MSLLNSIINWFKGGTTTMQPEELKVLFRNTDITKAYDQYNDCASYIDNVIIKSMNASKAIVQEIQRPVLQEYDFTVNTTNESLLSVEKTIKKQLKKLTTHLLIAGRVAWKPYIVGNKISTTVVTAKDFVPKYDNYGNLIEVLFKTSVVDKGLFFTLVERHIHVIATSTYIIENRLYKSRVENDFGDEVPLTSVAMFEKLETYKSFSNIEKHLCTVINLPNNNEDCTGKAIFADAYNLIEDLDKQYSRYTWEFEGGQLAIDADADLFQVPGKLVKNGSDKNIQLPFGQERLYRTINGHSGNVGINIFAPQLRDEAYERGINTIYRQIEIVVGLSAGKLSKASQTQLTATEIISAQQRFYSTVTSIQNVISEGIEDIMQNIVIFSKLFSLPFINNTYKIIWDVGDSILTTSAEKVQERLLLVEKGIYTIDEFKEWYEKIV